MRFEGTATLQADPEPSGRIKMKTMTRTRSQRRLVSAAMCCLLLACGGAGAADVVDASTLKGKVLLGYQGWFRCPGGGTMGSNWSH